MPSNARKSPDEIRTLLEGPVCSIPTPFAADGEVDWDGVANIVEVAIAGGSGVILLTAGDSQFFCLSEDETARLTRFTIERTAGRALTVAATGVWSTAQSQAFAERCVEWGADLLMPITTFHAFDPDGIVAHQTALSRIIPVMLVGAPSHPALDLMLDAPGICCFKEDGAEEFAFETFQKYGHHWKFMTGGGLRRHLVQWPVGYRAFMDWSSSFAPHIGAGFWQALCAGNAEEARRVTVEVERPLMELSAAPGFVGGWQAMWRAMLELTGVASRYMRSPQLCATDESLDRIRPLLKEVGLSK